MKNRCILYLLIFSSVSLFGRSPDYEVKIVGETGAFTSNLQFVETKPGLRIYTFSMKTDQPTELPKIKLNWRIPASDINAQWTTNSHSHRFVFPNWSSRAEIKSRATNHAPVFSLISQNDGNKITFAIDDALNTSTLRAGVKEEDGFFDCEVLLFHEKLPLTNEVSIQLRIDTRDIKYYESLNEVAEWWAAMPEYKPMQVPEHAKLPMYSSWYTFHQNLVVDKVLEQVRLAKKLGYESIIIDDGWQTLDSNRGYSYTGDWKPERIGDMKQFVDLVHDEGMKFILWYSVPYIGDKSQNFERFKGKYLSYWGGEWGGSYTIDPRYSETREFMIETYKSAVNDWGLDGFKLDFVDQFTAKNDTKLTLEDGRDFASVNQATDRFLTDVTNELTALNKDILIEFRQSYIGPLMRKYGNMFRAGDVPDSYEFNRVRTTDLRLLSGNTPVHSDMLMWHPKESTESAALQMLNVLFSVPQLSVDLTRFPQEHIDMIHFWTGYWIENRDVLLNGTFQPSSPALNYPMIKSQGEESTIIATYGPELVNLDDSKRSDIINARLKKGLVLRLPVDGRYKIQIKDCAGQSTRDEQMKLKAGLHEFEVPESGLIRLERVD